MHHKIQQNTLRYWCIRYVVRWTSRRTVSTDGRNWTRQSDFTGHLFFHVRCTSFHNHSPLLTFFCCFIVLFQSCCSQAQVFGKTLVHEFPISYSHTEWNLLSSGTNTLLRWRACYKATKLQTNNVVRSQM